MKRVRDGRWAIALGVAAIFVGAVVGVGLIGLRGGSGPGSSGPSPSPQASSGTLATPAGTGIVASLPFGQFAWSPDGAYLLVWGGDDYVTRVYDRFGRLVSQFGSIESWLDATHVIDGDGYVADVLTSHTGGPTANSWTVGSGHRSAAIIVGVPGCVGDPIIDWYRNGRYVKADERATPFGWSLDGRLLLLGHMSCSSADAETYGWKGPVGVVDFSSGRVLATAPDVRGEMALNPGATRLAADSDKDLEILDIASGSVKTVQNARLLCWEDDDHVYALTTGGYLALVGATAGIPDFGGVVVAWAVPSSIGPSVEIDPTGRALRIEGADPKTTLLDLSSASLVVESYPTSDLHQLSAAQPHWWSPDGRMLVLQSSDQRSLDLISVDPAGPAETGGAPSPGGS